MYILMLVACHMNYTNNKVLKKKKKLLKITTPKTVLVLTERKLDLGGEKLIFNKTLSLNIILNKTAREEEKENFNTTECYFIYMLFFLH